MAPNFATVLSLNIIGVALPYVRDAFGISTDAATWIMTSYMLPYALLMPLYGRLGDEYGKKRSLAVGMGIFTAATAFALYAPTLPHLVAGRILQGVGAAGCFPLGMAIIANRFHSSGQGKALGTWNSVNPAASVVAPFLGGLIVTYIGWQAIFWPVIAASLGAIIAVLIWVPGDRGSRSTVADFAGRFDILGLVTLIGAALGLMLFLTSDSVTGVRALRDIRLAVPTILFGIAFVLVELRHSNPFMDLKILRIRSFALGSLCAGLRLFAVGAVAVLIPLHIADVFHGDAVVSGMILTANGLAIFALMRLGGTLADARGAARIIRLGFLAQGVAIAALPLLTTSSAIILTVPLVLQGLAASLTQAPIHKVTMSDISLAQSGMAAGLYSLIRYFGLMMGIAVSGVAVQESISLGASTPTAYRIAWTIVASGALLGAMSGLLLRAED